MQVDRLCPECGAVNSLVVDYQRGEVVCDQCAIVTEMALLEDQSTAFETENMGELHEARYAAGPKESAGDKKLNKCRQLLRLLQTKMFVPEGVTERATDYCTRINRITRDVAGAVAAQYKPSVLAISAFLLAAPHFHHPIQMEEIFNIPQIRDQVKHAQVTETKRQIVDLLNLRQEQLELSGRIWSDYVGMLHRRLVAYGTMIAMPPPDGAPLLASLLASHFEDYVTSGFSVQKICAVCIILTYTADAALRLLYTDGTAVHPFSITTASSNSSNSNSMSSNRGNTSTTTTTNTTTAKGVVSMQQAPHDASLIESVTAAVIMALRTEAAGSDVRNILRQHLSERDPKRARLLDACGKLYSQMKMQQQFSGSSSGVESSSSNVNTTAAATGSDTHNNNPPLVSGSSVPTGKIVLKRDRNE